jgi:gas vesicle protein
MKYTTGILGFLTGGLVGAIVAMLYSPHSGEENRQIMFDQSRELRDKAMKSFQDAQQITVDTLNDAQSRLETINKQAAELIKQLQEIGQITLEEQKQSMAKGLNKAKEAIRRDAPVVETENNK